MIKAIFIFLLCLGSLMVSKDANAQSQVEAKNPQEVQKLEKAKLLELKVEGMRCQAGCADGIDHMLSRQKGIVKHKTTFTTATSEIWYDDKKISKKKIVELVNDLGFKANIKQEPDNQ